MGGIGSVGKIRPSAWVFDLKLPDNFIYIREIGLLTTNNSRKNIKI